MADISLFDAIGPIMVGPSSSHTAGAVSMALLARKIFKEEIERVDFTLYGSFAKTYKGHGTDKALLGGILGFETDDLRIRDAFVYADKAGLKYSFSVSEEKDLHPNTADIHIQGVEGETLFVRGVSLGGGKVKIIRVNDEDAEITEAEYNSGDGDCKESERVDFETGEELLELCAEKRKPISEIMKCRESYVGSISKEQVENRMKKALDIMRSSTHEPIKKAVKSMGGLIGGEAQKVEENRRAGGSVCGEPVGKAIAYAMAVLEANASMGVIVAAPTAGSAGVIPGVLFSLKEYFGFSDEKIMEGLYTAGAVGYLLMRNASVSGAQAGCQAEVGSASAMAAAAVVELMGGTPEGALSAASGALSNLLGLVCDPVAGLVENPCQNRNCIGAVNALINAEQVLAGIYQPIPFDEMAQAMLRVGQRLPFELRESALGGCAATPTACKINCQNCY